MNKQELIDEKIKNDDSLEELEKKIDSDVPEAEQEPQCYPPNF